MERHVFMISKNIKNFFLHTFYYLYWYISNNWVFSPGYVILLTMGSCVSELVVPSIYFQSRETLIPSRWVTHSPTLRYTKRTPSVIHVENVHFYWFNQYLYTGEHFQSDLDIFQFDCCGRLDVQWLFRNDPKKSNVTSAGRNKQVGIFHQKI